jgi:serine/threonine protein kinase
MFFQVSDGHPYGREVGWWAVGIVMYEMMAGLNKRPGRYPWFLTKDALDILKKVSCSSALLVSVMSGLFTILQQS